MKLNKTSGSILAAAAFTMALSGATISMTSTASAAEDKIHCVGVNACTGQSDCKSATNECKGLNSCKGQGFLSMTPSACAEAGGKIES